MKWIWIMFVLFGITQSLKAQSNVYEEDVIYLKNGSVLRGVIIQQEVGQLVKIRMRDGTKLSFDTDEIEKITREGAKFTKVKLRYRAGVPPAIMHEKGDLYMQMSYALTINQTNVETLTNFSAHIRGLKYLHRKLSVGVGTGFDLYEGGLIIPVYAEIQGDLLNAKSCPFYYVQGGYGLGTLGTKDHQKFEGGLMLHAGLGLHVYTSNTHSLIFSLGFKMQDTYQEFREFPTSSRVCCFGGTINPDSPLVIGSRRYQKVVWQFTYSF